MKNFTLEKLAGIAERIKNKEQYHYVCYAGSTVKKLDKFGDEGVLDCPYKGDDDWGKFDGGICPCKKCNGRLKGFSDCRDMQKWENYGIDKLLDAMRKEGEINE